jgi:hypothetical protein
VLAAREAAATLVGGVTYDLQRTAQVPSRQPHQVTTAEIDTTVIAPSGFREAVLRCDRTGAVNRVIDCDILTYDVCGNLYGVSENVTAWSVTVVAVASGATSAHVSPVVWKERGVARFFFTPLVVGPHQVTITRVPADLQALRNAASGQSSTALVVVHDSTLRWTPQPIGAAVASTQRMQWASGYWAGSPFTTTGLPPVTPTHTWGDPSHSFEWAGANELQQAYRRVPVQPFVPGSMPDVPPPTDHNDFPYVELVHRAAAIP